jgi:hypothetical protein
VKALRSFESGSKHWKPFILKAGLMLAKEYFTNPAQAQFQKIERNADLNAKIPMYTTMIKAGVYTTESEGKFKYEMESKK